jgi:CRISPR-associated protein Csb3
LTDTTLGGDPRRLITHLALYGLAAICADAGHTGLRLSWASGMSPRPHVTIAPDAIGTIVQAHARNSTWVKETIPLSGTPRGLMSPRLSVIPHEDGWRTLQGRRHAVLGTLAAARRDLDLRFLGALGEPCYWRFEPRTGRPLQDDAASRLEMQPRNTGAEFVGTRLSKIAEKVAARTPGQILDGLLGHIVRDELSNSSESRSATGLDAPGPADNALVWCALWGISQIPLALKVLRPAVTSASISHARREHLAVPLWNTPWHPSRLRTVLASRQLRDTAAALIRDETLDESARQWLTARGVTAIVTFPVMIFGSDKAPERRAGTGHLHPLGRPS